MVRIASALSFLAMGASIMAGPVVVDSAASEQNMVARADIGDKSSAVGAIADIVVKVINLVEGIKGDIEKRKAFTQNTAKDVAAKFPGQNVIVCNVGYSLSGAGDQLVYSTSYDAKIGADVTMVSFDVIVFKDPKTFDRQGDGGFQNWAYYLVSGCNVDGGHIEC
ncbi:ectomycorrhiza-regulated small secreted protein [Stemphylium lycopersici]|uniref:Ectomycorrhiza-regulated small secreted protein n=1 Tax=Stemphylium lycopersici TaxID=183478 RepID=A0A364N503_STELY|nr:ectomycorrhiza-regulated small secreted protein [Stemphylium lycopersici]RAR09632.1 ectomycorrhiza-regulated small secreted protein [Stemphylium lycopersici]RAR12171.1 ectomycorrhiza-regulated small secreted protein [Stemphylium lycopersici]